MKKLIILLTLILTITGFSGCWKKSDNQKNQPREQKQTFNVPYNDLASGQINETYKYSDPEEYDIYSSDNPLYYDKDSNGYKCSENDEIAIVTQIFPGDTGVGGPSRMAYYCPSENLYWIRDFPGYSKATVYGPFQGIPE